MGRQAKNEDTKHLLDDLAWIVSQGGRAPIESLSPIVRRSGVSLFFRQISNTYVQVTEYGREMLRIHEGKEAPTDQSEE